jgi:hypothetical protein
MQPLKQLVLLIAAGGMLVLGSGRQSTVSYK